MNDDSSDDKTKDQPALVSESAPERSRRLALRGRRHLERYQRISNDLRDGLLALRDKKFNQALQLFKKAVKADPERGESRYYLGLAHFMMNDYEAAADSFRAAIENGHAGPEAAQSLGDALMPLEQFEEAAKAYQSALAESPSAELYGRLGLALSALGKRDEAKNAIKAAIQMRLGGKR